MNFLYPESIRLYYPIKTKIKYLKDCILFIDTRSYIEWFLFANGAYEPGVSKVIASLLEDGDIVIELGANIGVHSLLISKIIGENGRLFAFEPFPPVYEKLKQHLNINNILNVKVFPYAVSDHAGQQILFYSKELSREGMSSLVAAYFSDSIEVMTTTLDDFVNEFTRVKLIKMDIQGSEYAALCGARKILQTSHPFIVFEYDYNSSEAGVEFQQIKSLLQEYNYNYFYKIGHKGEIVSLLSEDYFGEILASVEAQ